MQTTDLILVGGAVILGIMALVYSRFFAQPQKRMTERLRALHFQPVKFIEDTKTATFQYYEEKWSRMILIWATATALSAIGPTMLNIEWPLSAIISTVGALFSTFGMMLLNIKRAEAERARNVNKAFGDMFTFYPEHGDVGQLWKRLEKESEIVLDDTQIDTLVAQLAEGIKKLPNYDEKIKLGKTWRGKMKTRIKKMRVQRMSVLDKQYRILLVSPSNFEDTKTKDVKPLIDETVSVNVQRVPMFLVYAGTTRKLFKIVDDDGRPAWKDRTMGIFVDLFNINMRNKYLAEGGYTVLSKTDSLIAEYLHLYEQRSASATEMTKTLRDREKAQREVDENEFDAKAEAHKLAGAMQNMLAALLAISKPVRTKENYVTWLIVVIVSALLGKLLLP